MPGGWCLIESDPAVFTELIEQFGTRGIAVEETVALEPESLQSYSNVYGLVLLFKWKAEQPQASSGVVVPDAPVYFARQTVNNACATLAIVNTLLNFTDKIQVGSALENFYNFTQDMNAQLRGTQVGECDILREAHNSFAPAELFAMENESPSGGDVYHFVTFIYKNGIIWELDGLQEGPILADEAEDSNYKEKLLGVVQRRIAEKSAADNTGTGQGISFSLMSIVDDPLVKLEKEIEDLKSREMPTVYLEEQLQQLRAAREKGRQENIRRRHNYVPMIVELLKALSEKGKLQGIIDEVAAKRSSAGNR